MPYAPIHKLMGPETVHCAATHTAPLSFLSVLVDEDAARSHCSVFK